MYCCSWTNCVLLDVSVDLMKSEFICIELTTYEQSILNGILMAHMMLHEGSQFEGTVGDIIDKLNRPVSRRFEDEVTY